MICLKDYERDLRCVGNDYFISDLRYVPDAMEWSQKNGQDLGEPYHPIKLFVEAGNIHTMVLQAEVDEGVLDDVIKNLSMRWSVHDNRTNIDEKLNNTKKG